MSVRKLGDLVLRGLCDLSGDDLALVHHGIEPRAQIRQELPGGKVVAFRPVLCDHRYRVEPGRERIEFGSPVRGNSGDLRCDHATLLFDALQTLSDLKLELSRGVPCADLGERRRHRRELRSPFGRQVLVISLDDVESPGNCAPIAFDLSQHLGDPRPSSLDVVGGGALERGDSRDDVVALALCGVVSNDELGGEARETGFDTRCDGVEPGCQVAGLAAQGRCELLEGVLHRLPSLLCRADLSRKPGGGLLELGDGGADLSVCLIDTCAHGAYLALELSDAFRDRLERAFRGVETCAERCVAAPLSQLRDGLFEVLRALVEPLSEGGELAFATGEPCGGRGHGLRESVDTFGEMVDLPAETIGLLVGLPRRAIGARERHDRRREPVEVGGGGRPTELTTERLDACVPLRELAVERR